MHSVKENSEQVLAAPHYRRADNEGRTLIQSVLASAADLEVTIYHKCDETIRGHVFCSFSGIATAACLGTTPSGQGRRLGMGEILGGLDNLQEVEATFQGKRFCADRWWTRRSWWRESPCHRVAQQAMSAALAAKPKMRCQDHIPPS